MKKKGGMLALIVILMFQGIFGTGLGTFNGQRVSAAGAGNPDPNPGNPDPNPGNPGTSPGGTAPPGGNTDEGTPTVPGEVIQPGETNPVVPGEVDPEPIPVEEPEEDDTLVGDETAKPEDPSTPSAGNNTNRNPVNETKPEGGPIATLPKTGESNPAPFQLGGLALILAGFFLSRRLRNKRQ